MKNCRIQEKDFAICLLTRNLNLKNSTYKTTLKKLKYRC